jgi:hypothetical protein
MSDENVEIVRRSFEAYASGGIEATLPFYAPDFVWDPGPEWVEDTIYRGHDGVRRLDAILLENFDGYSLELHEIRAVGSLQSARISPGPAHSRPWAWPSRGCRRRPSRSCVAATEVWGRSKAGLGDEAQLNRVKTVVWPMLHCDGGRRGRRPPQRVVQRSRGFGRVRALGRGRVRRLGRA